MKHTFFLTLLMCIVFNHVSAETRIEHYRVKTDDIFNGYVCEKIWLNSDEMPSVKISEISYEHDEKLTKNAKPSSPEKFDVVLGMERKRPFAVVRVPVFASNGNNIDRVSEFTLTIEEQKSTARKPVARTTDKPVSILNTGKWYKIALTKTGFYKLDYNFITSLGVKPSDINPANIRVFGNGGNMLSEDNSVQRPSDLTENAIWVNSSGNSFGTNDYVIFYGVGPMAWYPDSINQRFNHQVNLYSDTAYYFINFDLGAGLRISPQTPVGAANKSVNSYNYFDAHEVDLRNPVGFGKSWYGEMFNQLVSNSLSQNFSFSPGSTVDSVHLEISFANTADVSGSIGTLSLNGNALGTVNFGITSGDNIMNTNLFTMTAPCNSSAINVNINFSPASTNCIAYLNYIEVNARRQLSIAGDQMNFCDWQSVGAGNIATYNIQGANSGTMVWDVTNPQVPVLMNSTFAGGVLSFNQEAQYIHQFAAMNSTNLYSPKYAGTVDNQNLHGLPQPNMIIVTYPGFIDQAKQLADYHRSHDNLNVVLATTSQIYNEFSSGGQDMNAIRDFERMFYKRAGNDTNLMPRFVILFGGASYDYKNRTSNNSNFVPVYESFESWNDLYSFSSDDFYGLLDDNEYIEDPSRINALDIGVSRIPARSISEATDAVNKIIGYNAPATLGPWRISTSLVADNDDNAGDHMENAEYVGAMINNASTGLYNEKKSYIDAAPIISTPGGARCPQVNAAINQQIYNGTFMVNYTGHGNIEVWASERILTQDDYNNWNNAKMLPFMVTATCDFGQFDHPQYQSAAEQLTLRKGGGVIVMLTTTQAVYDTYNKLLNRQYIGAQYTKKNGHWNTFADAYTIGKNATYMTCHDREELSNFRKFVLLGDGALTPDFPQYDIKIDSILDGVTETVTDTVKALGEYLIKGSVDDNNNNLLSGFNGLMTVAFYDKPRTIACLTDPKKLFAMQDNIIYKGRVSVTNGKFSFTFIAPKDINYYFGKGKMSMYADNGITDAAGADTGYVVGGYSSNPVLSTKPPVVKPYINDSLFKDGGITGTNTSLFVILEDSTGINVSGNYVGHDLTAILDSNTEQPFLLNDFYETAPNTFQRGYVTFPLTGLADGKHTITVRAWDVNNNTGEGTVNFVVINGRMVDIQNLMNYPNPFNGVTHFVFEHNHPGEQLNVKIEICNTSGALIKKLNDTFTPEGSWSNDITWDGTDENGERTPSGIYIYRLSITTDKGIVSSAYQKLVIIR